MLFLLFTSRFFRNEKNSFQPDAKISVFKVVAEAPWNIQALSPSTQIAQFAASLNNRSGCASSFVRWSSSSSTCVEGLGETNNDVRVMPEHSKVQVKSCRTGCYVRCLQFVGIGVWCSFGAVSGRGVGRWWVKESVRRGRECPAFAGRLGRAGSSFFRVILCSCRVDIILAPGGFNWYFWSFGREG